MKKSNTKRKEGKKLDELDLAIYRCLMNNSTQSGKLVYSRLAHVKGRDYICGLDVDIAGFTKAVKKLFKAYEKPTN